MARTLQDLRLKQSLPLEIKLSLTRERVRQWINEYGEDGVYISFSGGKDSTVLLDLVRNRFGYKNVKAVFVDTGLEYPEIRNFVKTFDNVEWLKPKLTFKQVIQKYGYPFISKEVSESVYGARKYIKELVKEGIIKDEHNVEATEELADILNDRLMNKKGGSNRRLAIILGMFSKDNDHLVQANLDKEHQSIFAKERYKFLLNSPFEISNRCCSVMKKAPMHDYNHKTGRKAMTAQMADESRLRTMNWLHNGCNGFNLKEPMSNPMAFWTEQDVLQYIYENELPICSVYGEVIRTKVGADDGQLSFEDYFNTEDCGIDNQKEITYNYHTTGCERTGCMFCGYGCQNEKCGKGRFELMKETHPNQYKYIMKPTAEGGLGYKEIIDWLNENGNLNIRY